MTGAAEELRGVGQAQKRTTEKKTARAKERERERERERKASAHVQDAERPGADTKARQAAEMCEEGGLGMGASSR